MEENTPQPGGMPQPVPSDPSGIKRYLPTIVGVAIVILIVVIASYSQPAKAPTGTTTTTETMMSGGDTHANGGDAMMEGENGRYEGILKVSDNPDRGQLMLETPAHIIYLRTSRDFTSLIDKDVVVTIDGTLDNFHLVDIVAK